MAAGDLVRLVTANELKGSTVYYGTCNTAAATAAKTATIDGFVLEEGSRVLLKMQTNNSAGSPTLNINNTGAKPISVAGGTPNIYWSAGTVLEFVYDGTYWCLLKEGIGNAASYGITKLSDTYVTKITNGAAANGVGASQNALYEVYNKLNTNLSLRNGTFTSYAADFNLTSAVYKYDSTGGVLRINGNTKTPFTTNWQVKTLGSISPAPKMEIVNYIVNGHGYPLYLAINTSGSVTLNSYGTIGNLGLTSLSGEINITIPIK